MPVQTIGMQDLGAPVASALLQGIGTGVNASLNIGQAIQRARQAALERQVVGAELDHKIKMNALDQQIGKAKADYQASLLQSDLDAQTARTDRTKQQTFYDQQLQPLRAAQEKAQLENINSMAEEHKARTAQIQNALKMVTGEKGKADPMALSQTLVDALNDPNDPEGSSQRIATALSLMHRKQFGPQADPITGKTDPNQEAGYQDTMGRVARAAVQSKQMQKNEAETNAMLTTKAETPPWGIPAGDQEAINKAKQAAQPAAEAQPAAAPAAGGPHQVKSDDDYNALPSGASFIGPDGVMRKKP